MQRAVPSEGKRKKTAVKKEIGAKAPRQKKSAGSLSKASPGLGPQHFDNDHERRQRILEAAYYRAEKRGFNPGGELDDWLAAEAEIDGPR
jgi:hypothetical protein